MAKKSIKKEEVKVVDEVKVEEVKVEESKPKKSTKVEESKPKGTKKVIGLTQRTVTYDDGTVVSITRAQHAKLVNGQSID